MGSGTAPPLAPPPCMALSHPGRRRPTARPRPDRGPRRLARPGEFWLQAWQPRPGERSACWIRFGLDLHRRRCPGALEPLFPKRVDAMRPTMTALLSPLPLGRDESFGEGIVTGCLVGAQNSSSHETSVLTEGTGASSSKAGVRNRATWVRSPCRGLVAAMGTSQCGSSIPSQVAIPGWFEAQELPRSPQGLEPDHGSACSHHCGHHWSSRGGARRSGRIHSATHASVPS